MVRLVGWLVGYVFGLALHSCGEINSAAHEINSAARLPTHLFKRDRRQPVPAALAVQKLVKHVPQGAAARAALIICTRACLSSV